MEVKISKGNTKLNRVWNLSLPPIKTCLANAPCVRLCYAMKAYRLYPATRNAWDHNLAFWQQHPVEFEESLAAHLSAAKKPVRLFRWHVGGDIPDLRYFYMMCHIATQFPDTKFLAFTKRYGIPPQAVTMPKNFTIVLSAWPGLDLHNPMNLPVAWMQDGTETRVPKDALECHGDCAACGLCWELPTIGKDVVFEEH